MLSNEDYIRLSDYRQLPTLGEIDNRLESHGWNRSVAGDQDFNTAVEALYRSCQFCVGVIVGGNYGVGKTKLVDAFINHDSVVTISLAAESEKLTTEWREFNAFNPFEQSIFLDDLGTEPITGKYGTYAEIVGDFIVQWHMKHLKQIGALHRMLNQAEELKQGGNEDMLARTKAEIERLMRIPRLFITTNLTMQEVFDRYGGRVVSRLKDVCMPLRLSGEDKREWLF